MRQTQRKRADDGRLTPVRDPKERERRRAEMLELYVQGHTLEEIGKRFGRTRERVRQLIRDAPADAHRRHADAMAERRAWRPDRPTRTRAASEAGTDRPKARHGAGRCVVCGRPMEHAEKRHRGTCSDGCLSILTWQR